MAVRIKDIAEYLELSPATVSMVLNGKPGFSEATRAKVFEAAKKLGYTLPTVRRDFPAPGESLPFVIYKHHGRVVAETPFFSSITEAIQREAKKSGYNLSVHYINGPENLTSQELTAITGRSRVGLIVLATEMERAQAEIFNTLQVPVVFLDNAMMGVKANKVLMGNSQGVYDAVAALHAAGHRTVGHLKSSVYISNFKERKTGFSIAVKDFGMEHRREWTARLAPNIEDAYQEMLEFCDKTAEMPTAFFADNDIIAAGAMKALEEKGYRLPQDISVIGFDDIPYCSIVEPNISTMQVDTKNIGRVAVQLLLANHDFHQKIEIETKLILRDSIETLEQSVE